MWTKAAMAIGILFGQVAMTGATENTLQLGFVDEFKALETDWHVANYDFDHPKFDTDWRPEQISVDKALSLTLQPHQDGVNRFVGASIRRENPSHYGRYEVTIQAARGEGVVTGFFTYTGPSYGTRHDEIDIEFLGGNTRQMHVAWFVDGKLTNHYIDLGFDAADAPRRYAFEWHPDRLVWFSEDKLIFEHFAENGDIPSVPGRLFVNIWAADPSIANWAGLIKEGTHSKAEVSRVSYQAM